jgi:hypothetical protein
MIVIGVEILLQRVIQKRTQFFYTKPLALLLTQEVIMVVSVQII